MKKELLIPTLAICFISLASCSSFVPNVVSKSEEKAFSSSSFSNDSLAGFDNESFNVKIWVDEKIVDLTRKQVQDFSSLYNNVSINATIEPLSEGTAAASMLQDVQSGADIFCFYQDQLNQLKIAGAVAKLSDNYVSFIKSNNSEDSAKAATIGSSVYAYPITNDGGCFLYYDKTIISDEDAKDMTKILAKCRAAGKTLNFEARSNGFYGASYFLATGCRSTWTIDDNTGKFIAYNDTFGGNSGLIALKGIRELADRSVVAANSQASKLGNTSAAVVSGVWEYEIAVKRLGDNLGCTEMPSFTVDEQSYHLSSFGGYKLLGVKPQIDEKKEKICHLLAQYLTNESCQTERFEQASWGPTNRISSQKEEVLNHPALAALRKQRSYACLQEQCPEEWYVTLSTACKSVNTETSDDELRQILNTYIDSLPGLLSDQ